MIGVSDRAFMLMVAVKRAGLQDQEFARLVACSPSAASRQLAGLITKLPDAEWDRRLRLVRITSGILDAERLDAEESGKALNRDEVVNKAIRLTHQREKACSTNHAVVRVHRDPVLLIDSHFTVAFTPDDTDKFLDFMLQEAKGGCRRKFDPHFRYHYEFENAGVVIRANPRLRKDGKQRRWAVIQFQRPRRVFRPAFADIMVPQFRKWVVPFVALDKVVIKRLDIAVDYDMRIGSFVYLAKYARKVRLTISGGRIETWDIGSRKSAQYYCIYDKALQEGQCFIRVPSRPRWTRVEVRLSFGKRPLRLLDLASIGNPFVRLTLLAVDDLAFEDGYYQLLGEKVRDGGLSLARQYCQQDKTWRDFVRQLRPLVSLGPDSCPAEMFALHWQRIAVDFLDALTTSTTTRKPRRAVA